MYIIQHTQNSKYSHILLLCWHENPFFLLFVCSSVCYNPYDKSTLASSDYDGRVCVWDTGNGKRVVAHQVCFACIDTPWLYPCAEKGEEKEHLVYTANLHDQLQQRTSMEWHLQYTMYTCKLVATVIKCRCKPSALSPPPPHLGMRLHVEHTLSIGV